MDEDNCYEYISIAKWPDDHFVCKKCGYDKYCKGRNRIHAVVCDVNMMKVQRQGLLSIKLNFTYT